MLLASSLLSVSASATTKSSYDQLPKPVNTRVWRCGNAMFIGRIGAGEVALYLESGLKVLSQISFIDEPVYQEDDIKLSFLDKSEPPGENVSISIAEKFYQNCSNDRYAATWQHAKLSGV